MTAAKGDTALGNPGRAFPSTIWSDVLAAADPSASQYRDRINQLLTTYWKPVYVFIRATWRKSVEESKDLTQAFFTHVLEKDVLGRVHPDRGSFRAYLKQALRHFLVDAHRAAQARQPDGTLFSLETAPGDLERLGPAGPNEPPERAFDREWFHCLVRGATDTLRESLAREGKAVYFEVFKSYCLDPNPLPGASAGPHDPDVDPGSPTYHDIAQRIGIHERDVGNYLTYCRKAFREILRTQIRDYVAGEGDVDRELEEFLAG